MPTLSSPGWQDRFLEALAQVPIIAYAAKAAGVNRTTVYRERKNNPKFKYAWEVARQDGLDQVELRLYERENDTTADIYILNTNRYKLSDHDTYDAMLEAQDHTVKMVWEDGNRDELPD